ncbi:FtsK/SpoIIIE domain-containing protein [Glutamicibacter sp. V16R2B1]|uniref:FtsK/SpoIIIE domain-containing protein n=1 Tax=unclassified Glutamicibacter TaxID=2627139 RepID=UPI0010FDC38B|nr:FtsK/SpoIIIE domain-containing protein [Glutamicibacter sp. V16R2B1]TLK54340.1 hypothetical protein FDN03_05455 [Glutamicibacter sp. V16R2B1]
MEEAAEALDAVYAEVRRRVEVIDQAGAENWQDLPAGSIRPWLVVIDEWAGLIAVDKKPSGDPKASPVVKEMLDDWNAHSSNVARIQGKVAMIAREARSAGIHLLILTQRPDATDLPGQVRERMGTVVQLVSPARLPSREALGMLFPGEMAAQASEEISDLFSGRPGFGLSYTDGGTVQGFQAVLIEPEEVAPYLAEIGVPRSVPLRLSGQRDNRAGSPRQATPATQPAAAPVTVPVPVWATRHAENEPDW